jgi:hypothetical protein
MNIELQLDYKTILRNASRPVHLVARLTAPAQPLTQQGLVYGEVPRSNPRGRANLRPIQNFHGKGTLRRQH